MKLFWDDPDPIDGNDYTLTSFELWEDGENATIGYGEGSTAEVPINEIGIIRNRIRIVSEIANRGDLNNDNLATLGLLMAGMEKDALIEFYVSYMCE